VPPLDFADALRRFTFDFSPTVVFDFPVDRRLNKSQQIGGPRRVLIVCCRFAARSAMEHSAPASDRHYVYGTTIARKTRLPPDHQLCGSPLNSAI
jgi:hypothetical protein